MSFAKLSLAVKAAVTLVTLKNSYKSRRNEGKGPVDSGLLAVRDAARALAGVPRD